MAKEVSKVVKLQVRGGTANPSPPVGPALGAAGVNIMEFCKQFNARTQDKQGKVLPVAITVYKDKSFEFVVKTPPAAVQILEAAKLKKGRCGSDQHGRRQRNPCAPIIAWHLGRTWPPAAHRTHAARAALKLHYI